VDLLFANKSLILRVQTTPCPSPSTMLEAAEPLLLWVEGKAVPKALVGAGGGKSPQDPHRRRKGLQGISVEVALSNSCVAFKEN